MVRCRGDMSDLGSPIARGASAELFAWGAGRVLKLYRPGLPPAAAEREAAHARAARAAGVATPAVFDVVTVDGRGGVVFERTDGPTMLEVLASAPGALEALAGQMAALHADMHDRAAPMLPWQHERLADKIGRGTGLTADARRAALDALGGLSRGQALCHGDLHPGNILMTAAGPLVIDWLNATRGDPAADVTRTALLFEHGVTGGSRAAKAVARLRVAFLDAYLHGYTERRPLPHERLEAWRLPVAAARLSEPLAAAERDALVGVVIGRLAER